MPYAYRNLEFYLLDEPLYLPEKYKNEINTNWRNEKLSGKSYTNDKLYTMVSSIVTLGNISIFLKETSFAHYLYSKKKPINHHTCRSVAANAVLLTSDGYLTFGKMSSHTSLSNVTKFIGGAISDSDRVEKRIDTTKTIARELKEETGIDLFNKDIVADYKPIFFLTRTNFSFINTLFLVNLRLDRSSLQSKFSKYRDALISTGAESELADLVFVKNNYDDVSQFLAAESSNRIDYMQDFVDAFYNRIPLKDITNEIIRNLPSQGLPSNQK